MGQGTWRTLTQTRSRSRGPQSATRNWRQSRRFSAAGSWCRGHGSRRSSASSPIAAGCDHAVAFSNCTAALRVALLAIGIGKGDRVAVTSYSWIATANVDRAGWGDPGLRRRRRLQLQHGSDGARTRPGGRRGRERRHRRRHVRQPRRDGHARVARTRCRRRTDRGRGLCARCLEQRPRRLAPSVSLVASASIHARSSRPGRVACWSRTMSALRRSRAAIATTVWKSRPQGPEFVDPGTT